MKIKYRTMMTTPRSNSKGPIDLDDERAIMPGMSAENPSIDRTVIMRFDTKTLRNFFFPYSIISPSVLRPVSIARLAIPIAPAQMNASRRAKKRSRRIKAVMSRGREGAIIIQTLRRTSGEGDESTPTLSRYGIIGARTVKYSAKNTIATVIHAITCCRMKGMMRFRFRLSVSNPSLRITSRPDIALYREI